MSRITLPRPDERVADPDKGGIFNRIWWAWVSRVTSALAGKEPLQVADYAVAGLPDADKWPRCIVVVTDDVGGECLAWSDGTNWRRVSDSAIVTA